jgi:hypothetical protein
MTIYGAKYDVASGGRRFLRWAVSGRINRLSRCRASDKTGNLKSIEESRAMTDYIGSLDAETYLEITALAVANVRRASYGLRPMTLKALKRDESWKYFRVEQRVALQALKNAGYEIVRGND